LPFAAPAPSSEHNHARYDQLNRITGALTTSTYSTSPSHCWGETYGLDAWGNLQSIAATTNSSYTGCSQESGFSKPADGNNHLSGFSYDASGNTSSDSVNSYTWDGESQLKSAAGVNYLYDGDGRRVAKVGSKLYWYGSGGEILSETDASGNTQNEYVFFGGKRIAQVPASSNPIYYVEDLLGTSRVITTNAGAVCYDADFYPYGGERSYTNTCPQNYKFEGKERDTETGNDDFGARYYSNRFGRWLSPDWSAVPSPVPYANLTNPQTLNLYSMVSDDPESFADLDGHYYAAPPEQSPNTESGQPICLSSYMGCEFISQNQQQGQNQNQNQTQANQPSAPDKPPSWDPKKPFPDDPSKLGPDWKPDPQHDPGGKSGDKRYVNPDGDKVDWHKGDPNGKGYWDKHDHWHWVPSGKKEKWHYEPGDTIKKYGPAIVKTGVVAVFIFRAIQVLEALGALAAL